MGNNLEPEKNARFVAETQATKIANGDPLPGPLKDVFAVAPDITVGPYKVRPVVDYDFVVLTSLNHPLHNFLSAREAQSPDDNSVRGQSGWELCYIFTRSIDEVDNKLSEGVQALKDAAKDAFGKRHGIGAMLEIEKAILDQFRVYWSPVNEYTTSENGEGATRFFQEPGKSQEMAPAGSLKSSVGS